MKSLGLVERLFRNRRMRSRIALVTRHLRERNTVANSSNSGLVLVAGRGEGAVRDFKERQESAGQVRIIFYEPKSE